MCRYDEMDFESKPLILVVGPYSVGKSTFIKYLIGSDYPDINIGSEPTTDRFIVVMKGPEKKVLQGHALVNHKGLAFRTLHKVRTQTVYIEQVNPCRLTGTSRRVWP